MGPEWRMWCTFKLHRFTKSHTFTVDCCVFMTLCRRSLETWCPEPLEQKLRGPLCSEGQVIETLSNKTWNTNIKIYIDIDLKNIFCVSGQIIEGGFVCMILCNFDVRENELKFNCMLFIFIFTITCTFSCNEQTKYGTMLSLWNCLINFFFCHYLGFFRVYCTSQQQSMCATSF